MRSAGGVGRGARNNIGIEEAINTVVMPRNTSIGMGLTQGCRSRGVWHWEQIGMAPLGGRRTMAGPQQQDGQRKRGIYPMLMHGS